MWNIATVRSLYSRSIRDFVVRMAVPTVLGCAALCSLALAAQDRYTLKIPNGLAWSEFRGYENWQDVAVSQTESSLKVIAANDAMMKAFKEGLPANGKLFPDQNHEDRMVVQKEHCIPLFCQRARLAKDRFVHRKRYKAIPEHARMGVCPVGIRCGDRHV
jgi:hypothetical protein